MGGASRLIMLLATPFPLMRHSCPSLLHVARQYRLCSSLTHLSSLSNSSRRLNLTPTSRRQLGPINSSQQIHTQPSSVQEDHLGFSSNSPASHPWPEWSKLIGTLNTSGYFDNQRLAVAEGQSYRAEDEFATYEDFPEEFVRASSACLAFARERPDLLGSLSRRDSGVIVENGTPFIFKSALDTARRMRAFLGISGGNVLESDKAHTVDLMKYILSYASNPTVSSERGSPYRGELIESSVRNLLSEMVRLSCGVVLAPGQSSTAQYQFPGEYEQTPRPLQQNIQMKRGDWICPRCSFMNFARNNKCLECEETRPKRQLAGGEWECPQCDFFNYGRNLACLRCDCKRPGEAPFGSTTSSSGLGYSNVAYANKPDIDSRLAANDEKAQRWFSKVSQLDSATDLSNAAADEDFPEIIPLRKGVNRFVVSTRKTPLERRLANSQFQNNFGNDFQGKSGNTSIGRNLDEILGRPSTMSDANKKNVADGQNGGIESSTLLPTSASPQNGHPKGSNSNYVPFVPLPSDMFAKRSQDSELEDNEKVVSESLKSVSSNSASSRSYEPGKSVDSLGLSEVPSNQAESEDKEKEQTEKSDRWFKKLAELHDVKDLASEIPDEDFPEIMPMRKGENRFVVSKKKDRSLTSPMYKRRMAMEQAGSSNFVPFVPFPPDYFAKKNKQQPDGVESIVKATGETSSTSMIRQSTDDYRPDVSDSNFVHRTENQQNPSRESLNERKMDTSYGSQPISGNSMRNSSISQTNYRDAPSTGYSGKESTIESTNFRGNSPQQPENQNAGSGWAGKSLEGSAVEEPDPLDMSEEAKAQRWFRRVAQIKDISELSNIPDEDFPSIMPMRKGVNRFVVSKRKTPLERRLTSSQYRRNLPTVSSDPVKNENDNN